MNQIVAVLEALSLMQEAIRMVELAGANNPSPDQKMELMDMLADLETVKDELQSLRDAMRNDGKKIKAPPADLVRHVQDLTAQVETARQAGSAASAAMDVAGDALSTGMTFLSMVA